MNEGVVASAIFSALSAGVLAGGTDAAKEGIVDSYHGLKALIKRRFGHQSEAALAISQLQAEPESVEKKIALDRHLAATNADDDPELVAAARSLLSLTRNNAPRGDVSLRGKNIAFANNHSTSSVTVHRSGEGSE